MAEIKDTDKAIKESNKIIKSIGNISRDAQKSFNKIKDDAIDKTIKVNNNKTPFRTSSIVASQVNSDLRKVIKDVNKDFKDFILASGKYLSNNYAINLTKRDLEIISRKQSVITDSLVANTTILNQDIQNILTQNLGKGISEKQLVQELKELYPAYSRNASSILNTGTSRLFIDINVSKFKDSGFNWYIWAGPDDKITRDDPCKKWVWHRFSASQLETITATRLRLWNCRHSIIPISNDEVENYPIGDIRFA